MGTLSCCIYNYPAHFRHILYVQLLMQGKLNDWKAWIFSSLFFIVVISGPFFRIKLLIGENIAFSEALF